MSNVRLSAPMGRLKHFRPTLGAQTSLQVKFHHQRRPCMNISVAVNFKFSKAHALNKLKKMSL